MEKTPKDLLILSELRKNARESLTKISRRTRIPISTIHDKIKTNLDSLIKKNCALINFKKLGFATRINLMIKLKPNRKEEAKEFLKNNFHVNTLLRISNEFDFLVELVFKDLEEAENFIDEIEKRFEIELMKKYFIVDEIKKEEFLSDKNMIELLAKN